MAQSVLKPCEICTEGLGAHYCLQCKQYFCGICKAQHNRQKVSRNHEFQRGENVVQEVKLRCEEHKEDFLFGCDKCKVPISMQCVTGKHMLSDCKQPLENAKAIEKGEENIRQSRDDAATIQHLQKLNDESSKLSVVPLPEIPSVKYSPRSTSDSAVGQLIGTYSLSETQTNKAGISPASYISTAQTEGQRRCLWKCSKCGHQDIYPVQGNLASPWIIICPSCGTWMTFIKEV